MKYAHSPGSMLTILAFSLLSSVLSHPTKQLELTQHALEPVHALQRRTDTLDTAHSTDTATTDHGVMDIDHSSADTTAHAGSIDHSGSSSNVNDGTQGGGGGGGGGNYQDKPKKPKKKKYKKRKKSGKKYKKKKYKNY